MVSEIETKENLLIPQCRRNNKIIYLPFYINRKMDKYDFTVSSRNRNKENSTKSVLLFFRKK